MNQIAGVQETSQSTRRRRSAEAVEVEEKTPAKVCVNTN